jgi:integrase
VRGGKWERIGTSLIEVHRFYANKLAEPKGELSPLIDAALDRMKKRVADPLSPKTIEQYTHAAKKLKHLLREFTSPGQVKQKHAAQVKILLASTPNMANRILSFARQVFNDFVEQQLVDSNPFLGVKRHKEAKRTRLITWTEWNKIRAKAGPRLQAIMDLLFLTGQRIENVLKIRLKDLTDDGILFPDKKNGRPIIVRWTDELRSAVERAKALHGPVRTVIFDRDEKKSPPLLPARAGKAPEYRTVLLQWHEACSAAGVRDANPHDIRAMALTAVKNQRGKPAAKALGDHATEANTERYLRDREIPVVDGPAMVQTA